MAAGAFIICQDVTVVFLNHDMGIKCQLGLKGGR